MSVPASCSTTSGVAAGRSDAGEADSGGTESGVSVEAMNSKLFLAKRNGSTARADFPRGAARGCGGKLRVQTRGMRLAWPGVLLRLLHPFAGFRTSRHL